MTRALVTQMLEAMEEAQKYAHNVGKYLHGVPQAITAAREYLATEQLSKAFDAAVEVVGEHRVAKSLASPSSERAELIARLIRKAVAWDYLHPDTPQLNVCRQAADMLEADAQYRGICSDYANVQTNEAVRYQKRIRDLEKQVAQQAKPTDWSAA